MKPALVLSALLLLQPLCAHAETPDLTGFQEEDGAITVAYKGDTVDPYFATKALLLAADGGFDITAPGGKWVKWLKARQRADGLFERYRRDPASGQWQAYDHSDADDAMLALWMELLSLLATSDNGPWRQSFDKAAQQLASLYDPALGIYHISAALPVGLLMDNVEIYAALRRMSWEEKRLGNAERSAALVQQARQLKQNLQKVFWDEKAGNYRITTQDRPQTAEIPFYPDKVAQIYPLLYITTFPDRIKRYKAWIKDNRQAWLDMRSKDYPWGMVTALALRMGDADSAFCWQNQAAPFRYSPHWNVLEEMAFQYVGRQLALQPPKAKVACVMEGL